MCPIFIWCQIFWNLIIIIYIKFFLFIYLHLIFSRTIIPNVEVYGFSFFLINLTYFILR